jgi:hypothetical protein
MAAEESKSELSEARELACFLGELGLVFLLGAACVLAPLVAALTVSPWLGMALAAGSFGVWGRFGPRPCPGLLPGCLCLWGFAAILGSFVACSVVAVRGLLS